MTPISLVRGRLQLHLDPKISVQEGPWTFLFTIDPDKNEVIINDMSIPITSDASEPVIGFKDDPTADASLDDFWGSFDTLTGKNKHSRHRWHNIQWHMQAGALNKPRRAPRGPTQARTRPADDARQHAGARYLNDEGLLDAYFDYWFHSGIEHLSAVCSSVA